MITLYDMAAAAVYLQAWLDDADSGSSTASRSRSRRCTGRAASGPALSVRTRRGPPPRPVRLASRTAIVRVGSPTWIVQDRVAADSMRVTWRHIAELAPIILGRQAPTRRRRG